MRQNSNQRRGRSRNNQNRRPGRNQSFDSNGPSVRLRGTAAQLNEKYQALARDATSAGDRVMAENYHQHADHYYRVMISLNPPQNRDEDRQPDLADAEDAQPLDGRGRGERGQNQGPQTQDRQNQDRQSQDRRDNRNRRSRDRQEDGAEPPAASDDAGAADRAPGAEAERRGRDRRQTVRRQDSDPRRRSGGRADEEVPGDEPLDQGLHRILGGGSEKPRRDGRCRRACRERRGRRRRGRGRACCGRSGERSAGRRQRRRNGGRPGGGRCRYRKARRRGPETACAPPQAGGRGRGAENTAPAEPVADAAV